MNYSRFSIIPKGKSKNDLSNAPTRPKMLGEIILNLMVEMNCLVENVLINKI